jgi:hypothetical protein
MAPVAGTKVQVLKRHQEQRSWRIQMQRPHQSTAGVLRRCSDQNRRAPNLQPLLVPSFEHFHSRPAGLWGYNRSLHERARFGTNQPHRRFARKLRQIRRYIEAAATLRQIELRPKIVAHAIPQRSEPKTFRLLLIAHRSRHVVYSRRRLRCHR